MSVRSIRPLLARVPSSLLATLAVLVLGCPPGPSGGSDAGGRICTIDADCDDLVECTLDSCGVGGVCEHLALDELCGEGQSCTPTGCRAGTACTSTAECDDGIACTVEQCVAGGTCRITPLDARCSDPTPVCDPSMGCVAESGCGSDAECDDGLACTLDACGVDRACLHDPIDARCMAGERCGGSGCYTPMPCTTAADCQDDDFCNGAEVCMPEFGCAPAAMPRACADTDDCTIDSCCVSANMCVFACDSSRPECMCPAAGSCEGNFRLTGSMLTFSCYAGMTGFDFTTANFAFDSGDLVITPARLYTPGLSGQSLRDMVDPRCPMFDAEVTFGGGCVEHYRLAGTFSDDDHFSGTLEWWYEDVDGFSCFISACMGRMSTPVTGVRTP
jgi:hypothetical protein